MQEIKVTSTLDGSAEPSLLYLHQAPKPAPLLVGLHTWSACRDNQVDTMLPYAQQLGWSLLLPEFRGANLPENPRAEQACGSRLAKQDIVDAVEQVCAEHVESIDSDRIYLLGGSGGGHMALLMAAYRPRLWRAVSAWCAITDLAAWHAQSTAYRPGIERCCGGSPADAPAEYRNRSPITCAREIAQATVFVYHGRWDGIVGSVPYTHSLKLYNAVLEENPDATVFLSIFDGGHELRYDVAFADLCARERRAEDSGKTALTR